MTLTEYGRVRSVDRTRTLFGRVMWYVAATAGRRALIYSVLGLVIFAGLTMVDFQRLRRSTDLDSAPFIAASIFLDVLNVFLFFLQIFDRRRN
jgi:FtsH-binding integral membrane protein